MEMRDPDEFERKIYAKSFDPARFRGELGKLTLGETIALGTATDPYQPAERRYGITRKMLEVFATTAGFHLGITTKSDLIARTSAGTDGAAPGSPSGRRARIGGCRIQSGGRLLPCDAADQR
jgi:hypothetical protein